MSLCKDCISGVTHEGTPTGKLEQIGGFETYVAIPSTEYPKDKAILFLPDAFGVQLINNKLLVDDFARNGFQTYAPDYFNGDPAPYEAMMSGKFDVQSWLSKHGPEQTRPTLDGVINALKAKGITTFGATGYCFGGRYTFDLAYEGTIKVAVVAHPSLLVFPDDLHKFKETNVPLLVNSCETDEQFPQDKQKLADDILGGGKFAAGYERVYWEKCNHGFAVRGDLSNPYVKAAKEGSFKNTVEWFIKHL